MKKLITLSIITLISFNSFAQKEKYEAAMKFMVSKIQETPFDQTLIPLSNQMERLANVEVQEWLPNYWVAYCHIQESYLKEDGDEKDLLLDKAESFLKKAVVLSPNNDELEHLQAFYANARMIVAPMTRWMKYGEIVSEHSKKAHELNPNNPRVALLEATGVFYTPATFGGGEDKAKPMFEKAKTLYESFVPRNEMMPTWGMNSVIYHLSKY